MAKLELRYDRAGRSEGTAFVTYETQRDAEDAIREYNGANAAGKCFFSWRQFVGGRTVLTSWRVQVSLSASHLCPPVPAHDGTPSTMLSCLADPFPRESATRLTDLDRARPPAAETPAEKVSIATGREKIAARAAPCLADVRVVGVPAPDGRVVVIAAADAKAESEAHVTGERVAVLRRHRRN